jgi:phosphatidate cytidylyltransferase
LLRQRILTALVLLVVLYLGTVMLPIAWFGGFLVLVLLPALFEWGRLMGLSRKGHQLTWVFVFSVTSSAAYLVFFWVNVPIYALMLPATAFWLWVFWTIRIYPEGQSRWEARWKIGAMGVSCLLPTWVGLFYLKQLMPSGFLVLILIAVVSIVDIGAYFTGRAWGKKKLAPALSPKKSWAGFWGGITCSVALSAGLLFWLHNDFTRLPGDLWMLLLAMALLLAVFSVIGDLFESMLKRHRGIKDSGRTLPGHGGILDRIDSLVAATPVFVLAMSLLEPVLEAL